MTPEQSGPSWDEARMWMVGEMKRMTGVLETLVDRVDDMEKTMVATEAAASEREKLSERRTRWVAALYGGTAALLIALLNWLFVNAHK